MLFDRLWKAVQQYGRHISLDPERGRDKGSHVAGWYRAWYEPRVWLFLQNWNSSISINNILHQTIMFWFILFKYYSRDDHQFSPLHWAAKGGHTKIVEMLMSRGARVHTTNMGDDTPLHLAAAFGNRDIVLMVIWHQ